MSEKNDIQSGRIKLLLVDDEVGYVDVLANRLGKRNIDVTKALNGTEAIQAMRKQDFDVAVLDLKMEDMDGIEVLKVFKNGSEYGGHHAHRPRVRAGSKGGYRRGRI